MNKLKILLEELNYELGDIVLANYGKQNEVADVYVYIITKIEKLLESEE